MLTAALIAAGVAAPAANADHHLMKIREVYPGTVASPGSEFVELQMHSPSQTNLSPSRLDFYSSTGTVTSVGPLLDVDSGDSQRTALIGTTAAASDFGVALDFVYAGDDMAPAGGAACFESTLSFGRIDCVRWGTMTGAPAGTGSPEGAIPDGSSIERSIAPGCPTLLEDGDDTNDSAADFAPATPSPRANATAPTESRCPQTTITKKPRARTQDRTPTFKFTSQPDGFEFECKLDGGEFAACDSPFKPGSLSRGKHKFRVAAGGDPTPAKHNWKIVKP